VANGVPAGVQNQQKARIRGYRGSRSNLTGHHEALLPTVCERLSWCKWTSISHGDVYRYRPLITLEEAERDAKPGRLYHPVKSAEALRAFARVEV
jgi:hypothetical protein